MPVPPDMFGLTEAIFLTTVYHIGSALSSGSAVPLLANKPVREL